MKHDEVSINTKEELADIHRYYTMKERLDKSPPIKSWVHDQYINKLKKDMQTIIDKWPDFKPRTL